MWGGGACVFENITKYNFFLPSKYYTLSHFPLLPFPPTLLYICFREGGSKVRVGWGGVGGGCSLSKPATLKQSKYEIWRKQQYDNQGLLSHIMDGWLLMLKRNNVVYFVFTIKPLNLNRPSPPYPPSLPLPNMNNINNSNYLVGLTKGKALQLTYCFLCHNIIIYIGH